MNTNTLRKPWIPLLSGIAVMSILWWIKILPFEMWIDEVFSSDLVNHNWAEVLQRSADDYHPPLYNFMLKLFTDIFGYNIVTLRGFAYLTFIGILLLAAFPVNKALGHNKGWMFAFIYTFTPAVCLYVLEIRMYALASLLLTACVVYMYKFYVHTQTKDGVITCIFGILAAYTHYYALVAVAAAYGMVVLYVLINRNFRVLKPICICIAISVLSYLPWVYILATQMSKFFTVPYIDPLKLYEFIIAPGYFYFVGSDFHPQYQTLFMVLSMPLLVCVGALGLTGMVKMAKTKMKFTLPLLCMFVFGITMLFFTLFSIFVKPLFYMKYLTSMLGIFCILIADSFGDIKSGKLRAGIMVIFVASAIFKVFMRY